MESEGWPKLLRQLVKCSGEHRAQDRIGAYQVIANSNTLC